MRRKASAGHAGRDRVARSLQAQAVSWDYEDTGLL